MNSMIKVLAPYLNTDEEPIAEMPTDHKKELWIYADYERALLCGKRVEVGKKPILAEDGRVYVVSSAVSLYLGKALPGKTIGGVSYTTVEDIKAAGAYLFYNRAIAVLVIGKAPMAYKNDDPVSLRTQILALADLIFYDPDEAQLESDIKKTHGEIRHPFFQSHTAGYGLLREMYENASPATEREKILRERTLELLAFASNSFDKYFILKKNGEVEWNPEGKLSIRHPYFLYDEEGRRLLFVQSRTYKNAEGEIVTERVQNSKFGDGYDIGNRLGVEPTYQMNKLATAYAITGEKKYLEAARLMAYCADEWEHWGDGHFLGCSAAASGFSSAFDIIYNDISAEEREHFADILYRKGLLMGYSSVHCNPKLQNHASPGTGGYKFHERQNNWVSVCAGGMFRAACMLYEFPRYREMSLFMMKKMISILRNCLAQYAPDGAYLESPGYWSYGTEPFVSMIEAMLAFCGTDYGYLDTVGFADSFYYASRISDNRLQMWNFHDCKPGKMSTSLFYFAARYFNNPVYVALRDDALAQNPKSVTLRDILNYDFVTADGGDDASLDYVSYGIQTATFRSTWDKEDFHFAGLHGGASEATHGDSDAGNFYLTMGGELWFGDPGCEDYNVGDYWSWKPDGNPRYRYYKKSGEGHNLVLLLDEALPRGQVFNTHASPYAKIIDYQSTEDHAHMALNMTPQYGDLCKSAKRALALTEGRSVVLLRDEMEFTRPTTALWIATPETKDIAFSENGRIAYLKKIKEDGSEKYLRASILSEDERLHFEIIPADTVVIDGTITEKNSGNERATNPPVRLAIRGKTIEKFNLTIVFEMVDSPEGTTKIQEKNINNW